MVDALRVDTLTLDARTERKGPETDGGPGGGDRGRWVLHSRGEADEPLPDYEADARPGVSKAILRVRNW